MNSSNITRAHIPSFFKKLRSDNNGPYLKPIEFLSPSKRTNPHWIRMAKIKNIYEKINYMIYWIKKLYPKTTKQIDIFITEFDYSYLTYCYLALFFLYKDEPKIKFINDYFYTLTTVKDIENYFFNVYCMKYCDFILFLSNTDMFGDFYYTNDFNYELLTEDASFFNLYIKYYNETDLEDVKPLIAKYISIFFAIAPPLENYIILEYIYKIIQISNKFNLAPEDLMAETLLNKFKNINYILNLLVNIDTFNKDIQNFLYMDLVLKIDPEDTKPYISEEINAPFDFIKNNILKKFYINYLVYMYSFFKKTQNILSTVVDKKIADNILIHCVKDTNTNLDEEIIFSIHLPNINKLCDDYEEKTKDIKYCLENNLSFLLKNQLPEIIKVYNSFYGNLKKLYDKYKLDDMSTSAGASAI